jgi:hypothetical protein
MVLRRYSFFNKKNKLKQRQVEVLQRKKQIDDDLLQKRLEMIDVKEKRSVHKSNTRPEFLLQNVIFLEILHHFKEDALS